ncbi:MAG: AAA family ATPase, partial [Candidatus Dormibacteraceae bacterium]
MRLKAITLQGFKTFAQRTEVLFEGGVTAVVGPNGSGKSNIVDAFKLVLGESRARDLRGTKMEEVVYSGGTRRSRASVAEVTLLIDNTERRLPIDYQEVAIRRRVDRQGQSDYFLNQSRVRRRDVLELLASTGMTTDSYAIVDQRDIEHIVGCAPEQRRLLIEEAAMVRGVKAKRSEATGQLEDAVLNLTRLEDLRGELEPRLEVVRAQARAATEALAAGERLELLRGSIAWEEWREVRERHKKLQRQLEALQGRLTVAHAAVEAAEAEHGRCTAALQAAQDRRLARQQAVGAARLELSNAEHALVLAKERIGSRGQIAQDSRRQLEALDEQIHSAAARQRELETELAVAEEQLAAQPAPTPLPSAEIARQVEVANRQADKAAREQQAAESQLAQAETRTQLLT